MTWYQQPEDIASPNYPSNYNDDEYQEYSLKFPGAKQVRLHFDDFYTESYYSFAEQKWYDTVRIYQEVPTLFIDENGDHFVDENGNNFSDGFTLLLIQELHGNLGSFTTDIVEGDTIHWVFESDGNVNYRGWHIDYIEGEYELETQLPLELTFDRPLPNDWPPDVYTQEFLITFDTPVLESYPVPNIPPTEFLITFDTPVPESYPIPVLPSISKEVSFPQPVLTRRIPEVLPPIYKKTYRLELKEPEISVDPVTGFAIFNEVIPIYVPMVSCQIQLSIDAQNYASAVIPNAIRYQDYFATKTILTIYHVITEVQTGGLSQKDVLAVVKLDDIAIDQTPSNYSANIKGNLLSGVEYRTEFRETFRQVMGLDEYEYPTSNVRRELVKVRSIDFTNGKLNVECELDPFLKPGFIAVLPDSTEIIVGRLSFRLSATAGANMTVEER